MMWNKKGQNQEQVTNQAADERRFAIGIVALRVFVIVILTVLALLAVVFIATRFVPADEVEVPYGTKDPTKDPGYQGTMAKTGTKGSEESCQEDKSEATKEETPVDPGADDAEVISGTCGDCGASWVVTRSCRILGTLDADGILQPYDGTNPCEHQLTGVDSDGTPRILTVTWMWNEFAIPEPPID